MRLGTADLLGMAIGLALGGAVLVLRGPQWVASQLGPVVSGPQSVATVPAVGRPALLPAMTQPRAPGPAPLPVVTYPGRSGGDRHALPMALPNVVHPAPLPPPTQGMSGTGFFIGDDGSLLTAAHVVPDCRRLQVVSRLVPLMPARLVAADQRIDAALLRVERVRPPAVLPLGRPEPRSPRMLVLGFPAEASLTVPDETWGVLENGKLPPGTGSRAEIGGLVWLQAPAVTHGYSGGPILDPRSGVVTGLIKGSIDPAAMRSLPGMPTRGVTIGPDARELIAFVHRAEPMLDVRSATRVDDDTLAAARHATVHVLCWHTAG